VAQYEELWTKERLRHALDAANTELRRERMRVDVLAKTARALMRAILDYFDATNANNVNGEVWRAITDMKEVCNAARLDECK